MSSPHLAFASAAGGSVFMEELLEVVAAAVRAAGGQASTYRGHISNGPRDAIHVVVPHEYLSMVPRSAWPGPEILARTIAFSVEHPGTASFRKSESLLSLFGGVVDINAESVVELRRIGHRVERFTLGYSPLWDRWSGTDVARDIDVAYLGTAEHGRSLVLASAAPALAGFRMCWLTPPHEMMLGPRPDFLVGVQKHDLLARSRVLLNVHREYSAALEWVRVLEAMCNGSVVVTEPAPDIDSLCPGKHLVVARGHRIGDVTAGLLRDPELEQAIRHEAYRFVREELDMTASAQQLIDLAADLAESTPAPKQLPVMRRRPAGRSSDEHRLAVDTPCFDHATDPRRAANAAGPVDRLRAELAVAALYRGRSLVEPTSDACGPMVPLARRSAWITEVDVLVVRRRNDASVEPLLTDLALGSIVPRRVVVVHDGTSSPVEVLTPAAKVLHNREPTGEAWSRNRALDLATAERLLILTADLRTDPQFLQRLADIDADIVHCPVRDRHFGLVGALPIERRRLGALPYLGSGYLVSREMLTRLGGWIDDPWCEGLIDHAFWLRAAAFGADARLVPHPLAWRGLRQPGGRPIDFDPQRAWTQLRHHLEPGP